MAKRIHFFNFAEEGAHVALVDKAANMQEVCLLKADKKLVTVSLSMKDFLQKFFGLWDEDATVLAGVLGYTEQDGDEEVSSYDDYIQSKIDSISLLKGVDLPDSLSEVMTTKITDLMKTIGDKLPVSSETKQVNGESKMDEQEILDLQKASQEKDKQIADLLKSVEAQKEILADIEKAKAEKAKTEMLDVVKGYSFVPEDAQEKLANVLLATEDSDVILTSLEKAREAIKAAAMEDEIGTEGADAGATQTLEDVNKAYSLVGDILSKRKEGTQ